MDDPVVPKLSPERVKKKLVRGVRSIQRRVRRGEQDSESTELYPGQSAGFENWLNRRRARIDSGIAREWRRPVASNDDAPDIAVVIHVGDGDSLAPILDALADFPVDFDLFVTTTNQAGVEVAPTRLPHACAVTTLVVEDQGRDVLPLVCLANADLLDPYEVVLKLNSADGAAELAGTAENVSRMLASFFSDPSLGVVACRGAVHGADDWGTNQQIVTAILRRIPLAIAPDSLEFAAAGNYWTRAFILHGLRAVDVSEWDFEEEQGQADGTTAHAVERLIGLVTKEAGFVIRDTAGLDDDDVNDAPWPGREHRHPTQRRARIIARYSPRYHSVVSDEGWKPEGLGSWNAIAQSQPSYPGHEQPFLPADLGFYDLSTAGVRSEQYRLARAAGIDAFMYDYFWAEGKATFDGPVEGLAASDSDESFCLIWQNGSSPDGAPARTPEVDPAATPSAADGFVDDILHLLTDKRYVHVGGRPVLVVARMERIPNSADVVAHWGDRARAAGLAGLTVLAVDEDGSARSREALLELGADAVIALRSPHAYRGQASNAEVEFDRQFQGRAYGYDSLVRECEQRLLTLDEKEYPAVLVNRDNTVRDKMKADLLVGTNAYSFRRWLDAAVSATALRDAEDRVVFVDAWNSWNDGSVLEPSHRHGRSYLQAVRSVIRR